MSTATAPSPARPDCATRTKFHISLQVSDLARSLAFYRVLFDCRSATSKASYSRAASASP